MAVGGRMDLHASAFAYHGMGCLVTGDSGSGKSHLLAQALLYGAHPIADDRVLLAALHGHVVASAEPAFCGVMELRGFGLIKREDAVASHPIHLEVALGHTKTERFPEPATVEYLGIRVPKVTLSAPAALHIAPLLLYLDAMRDGRILPPDWHPGG